MLFLLKNENENEKKNYVKEETKWRKQNEMKFTLLRSAHNGTAG